MRFLCIIIALCGIEFLYAGISDSVHLLKGVEVTAIRAKEIAPSQKLSGANLERLNSLSVADAIRFFSGVQIKDYGGVGGLKTIDIRSMGTHHMGVFYDGIQLGNAQNGQIDLGKFSLDNIEEIHLYNGQKCEILQAAKDFGSAGSIYLKTRIPRFEENDKRNLRFVFRSGSFHLINPSFLWEQKLSSQISTHFNVEYLYSSGKYKFQKKKIDEEGEIVWDTTAVRENGDINALRLEAGVNGLSSIGKWQVKGYFYNSERGIPGAIVNNVWKHAQRQWDRNFFLQASYRMDFHPGYEMIINGKYAYDYMRYLNPDTTLMYLDNRFRQQEIYLSSVQKYQILKYWDISLASDFQWNTLYADLRNFVYPQRYTALIALASALQFPKISLQGSLLTSLVWDQTKSTKSNFKNEFTPALFLSYTPWKKHDISFRAFYKRVFRMPTFNDLYYTDIGNIDLKPEYTNQYNIGVQYVKHTKHRIWKSFDIKADAFYNTVNNKIIAVPKGSGQYRWMMMNLGYVKIRGIEFSGRTNIQLAKEFEIHLCANFTFQKAQDFSDPNDHDPVSGTYGGQIAYIPKYNASFILGLVYKTWDLNYNFIYVGERYHNSSNIIENYEQPWYTSDISIGKEFILKKTKWKLTAEINNLFNQAYEVILNYPMPGINCKFILRITL